MNTIKGLTKAERIYNATYGECLDIVMRQGYVKDQRLDSLVKKKADTMCQRTYNEIQRLIFKEYKATDIRFDRGMISYEQAMQEKNTTRMVENTFMHDYFEYMDDLLK